MPPDMMGAEGMGRGMGMEGMAPGMGTQTGPQSGFVVVIEGYSPYKHIEHLLDPSGVGSDQNRWGVVTRLENLGTLFPEIPFELFGKGDIRNFREESGWVDPDDNQMPVGIGILKEVERVPSDAAGGQPGVAARGMMGMAGGAGRMGAVPSRVSQEWVLFDPMTNEEISRTYDLVSEEDIRSNPEYNERDLGRVKLTNFGDPKYIERDYWFRIQAKFLWKDAPQDVGVGSSMGPGMYMPGGMY